MDVDAASLPIVPQIRRAELWRTTGFERRSRRQARGDADAVVPGCPALLCSPIGVTWYADAVGVPSEKVIGRYALFDEIASGGMATVHIGRLVGEVGFSRTVAIKRLHPQLSKDPEFVAMLVDEARLAARIRHPNVVPTLDAVKTEQELFLVMEYVHGESFHYLLKQGRKAGTPIPPRYVVPIVAGVLHGLHAAHEAKGEGGQPLEMVHRDVSPQNILVGTDGVPRVFDFGIAKACGRLQVTRTGQLKGKLPYMAPEQLSGDAVGRRVDIYAAAVVLWEALAGRRLFSARFEAGLLAQVLAGPRDPPSTFAPDVPQHLDDLVMRGLAHDPSDRFATAREMAAELERAGPCASPTEIGEWVEEAASDTLALRASRIEEIESRSSIGVDTSDKHPKTLGRYELIAELHKSYLGPGWAGRVASGAGVGSLVLIRRVYSQDDPARDGTQPGAVTKLAAAARASMPLRHERLVPVVDALVTDDELAIVSQYIEGETLRSLMWLAGIRRTPIPPPVALRIGLELLEGLAYLHSRRLADPAASSFVGLTADDVLVGTDGHTRILEPGVAGVAATLEPWSRHPKRACYDPPEQLREGVKVDLRADLFTVGVLLWEMLQNRVLFTGSNLSEVSEGILSGIIDKVDTSPSVPAAGMAGSLGDVVARALERDETARFQSAPEMATAITNAGEPIASPAEVTQLVERLAVSSLMVQRHRIDGDTVEAGKRKPTEDWETIPDTAPSAPWSAPHATAPEAHFAAAPRSAAVPDEVMPTTVLDPDGVTIPEDPSTGVRRLESGVHESLSDGLGVPSSQQVSQPGDPVSGAAPFLVADPTTGGLADLIPPLQPPKRRSRLLVAAGGIVFGVVVVGAVRVLTAGGASDESAAEPTASSVNGPSRVVLEPSAAGTASGAVEPPATAVSSTEPAGPRSPGGRGQTPKAKVDAGTSQPSAEPADSAKPPPKEHRYYPKGI